MAKFRKKGGSGGGPAISTASLPDIVFMLLFFFMVTTVMREVDLQVSITVPEATEVQKLEDKSLVNYIYVGFPYESDRYGTEPLIQLGDAFATIEDIQQHVEEKRTQVGEMSEKLIPKITTSLKVDRDADMGIVTDIKQKLRKSQSLKILYSTTEGAN